MDINKTVKEIMESIKNAEIKRPPSFPAVNYSEELEDRDSQAVKNFCNSELFKAIKDL